MNLFIEILDGNLQGIRAPLREGLTFGRQDCDVNLQDSKVSSKHARIEIRPDGLFWLVDLGSSNGIRTSKMKLTEVPLRPGLAFRLGQTHFEVKVYEASPEISDGFGDGYSDPAILLRPEKEEPRFFETIRVLAEKGIKKAPPAVREIEPFTNVLRFSITRGIQTGTKYVLGYGPREIGASSIDLPLFEPGLPAKCFKINPDNNQAKLEVHADAVGKVFLNGRFVETAPLTAGDMIDIGETRIEVSFEG